MAKKSRGAGPELVEARKKAFATLERALRKTMKSDPVFQYLAQKYHTSFYKRELVPLLDERVRMTSPKRLREVGNILPWTMVMRRVEMFVKKNLKGDL